MQETVLVAEPRTEFGKHAANRLRRTGRLPANIYGLGQENQLVSLDAKAFTKFFMEGHRIAKVQVGGDVSRSVVKEVQFDPYGSTIVHVDLTRIRRDQAIQLGVPIEAVGVPKGVTGGGVLSFPVQQVQVLGLPDDIPEHFPLSIESLEIGQVIRLKDLTPPAKCTFVGDPEMVIVGVMQKREEVVVAPAAAEPAQPEVIGRKREEGEEGAAPEGKEAKEGKEGKESKESKEGKKEKGS
jgi:large subunit ribosomal protein L25